MQTVFRLVDVSLYQPGCLRHSWEAGGIIQGACGLEQMVLKFILAALLNSYFPWKTFFFLELEVGEPLVLRLGQFSLSSRSLTPKDTGGSLAQDRKSVV